MATPFSNKQKGFLATILNWVQNQAKDQELLLTFYSPGTTPARLKRPRPPYPSAEESLAMIERQLANISADQATVVANFGATPAEPVPLGNATPRDDILYTIVLWNVYLSSALKAILRAEAGLARPSPKPSKSHPSPQATLASIVAWFDKSSSDLKELLVRGGLPPGPTTVKPDSPFPSVDASLRQIEFWGATITQDLLSVAMAAPRRGLGGKPQHPH